MRKRRNKGKTKQKKQMVKKYTAEENCQWFEGFVAGYRAGRAFSEKVDKINEVKRTFDER